MEWNILVILFALGSMVVGACLAVPILRRAPSFRNSLQIVVAVLGIPAFLFLSVTGKIPPDVTGAIMAAVLGFAVGSTKTN